MLGFIMQYAKPHKLKFILLFTCIILTTFIGSAYPYIFGLLVDEVFGNGNMQFFVYIVLLYGVIFLAGQLLHFTLNMSWAKLMTYFLYDIRTSLYKKVLSFKGKTFSDMRSGDIISRLNADVNQVMNFIHWNVFYLFASALHLVISIFMIFQYNLQIGVISIFLIPPVVFITRFFAGKSKTLLANISKKYNLLYSWLFEIFKGMTDVKLMGAGSYVSRRFVNESVEVYRFRRSSIKLLFAADKINSLLLLISTLAIYGAGAYYIYSGELTVGGFIAVFTYFNSATNLFKVLSARIINISENMVGIERVMELFNTETEDYREDMPALKVNKGEVEFKNVTFGYREASNVLNEISFRIEPNTRVALVGKSGAGKSTITSLMYKLFEIDSGEIRIDGQNIDEVSLRSLRDCIGVVQQDTFIADGTLKYNLSLGLNKKITDEIINDALKKADLYDFVKNLPDGLDTRLGLRGAGLSGGQKQRLAIAKLLITDKKILIFDEATSALDSDTEDNIISSWDALSVDKTLIIIAHRLSTIINADKILVLDEGGIAGFDTHENLLAECGAYKELFNTQSKTYATKEA